MPYTKMSKRELYDKNKWPAEAGDLTYVIFRSMLHYVNYHGRRFYIIAVVFGCAFCAMLEFYRRVVVPYEKKKIKENGDIL
jgi:hypothetical protein